MLDTGHVTKQSTTLNICFFIETKTKYIDNQELPVVLLQGLAWLAMAVPAAVVQQVEDAMKSQKGINQQLQDVIAILEQHSFATKQTILPRQLLCHPENRGGAMLSCHDAWQKGLAMVQVGLQFSLLQNSIAIQLSKNENKRISQIQKNEHIIVEAQGHLAPRTGQERSLALFMHICSCFLFFILQGLNHFLLQVS